MIEQKENTFMPEHEKRITEIEKQLSDIKNQLAKLTKKDVQISPEDVCRILRAEHKKFFEQLLPQQTK